MYDVPGMIKAGLEIIDKVIPDADAKNRAREAWELEVLKTTQVESAGQSETNTQEAASRNLFVAGWRPFIGWICGLSFLWLCVGQPFFSWIYVLVTKQPAPVIALPTELLMSTLLGMLGLGTLRTVEKLRGASR